MACGNDVGEKSGICETRWSEIRVKHIERFNIA